MKTRCTSLTPLFAFAGFTFPKHVWTLPRGSWLKRLADYADSCTGDYYHAPPPNNTNGQGFYLNSAGSPGLRWQWADEALSSIRHTGWYCDDHGDGEKIRGLVFRLPRNRGFLAGWSMGESMASEVDASIYDTAEDAARAADSMAERAAENQRDFEQREREEESRLTTTLQGEEGN